MAKLKPTDPKDPVDPQEDKSDETKSEGQPTSSPPAADQASAATPSARGAMGLEAGADEGGDVDAAELATQHAPPPAAAAAPELARQSVVVICPYCKTRCRAGKTEAFFTRYYCPVRGCSFSHKVPRPRMEDRIAAAQAADQTFSAR